MDNERFQNCLPEQSPVSLYTVMTLGIFIAKSSVSEREKHCHHFAAEDTEGTIGFK